MSGHRPMPEPRSSPRSATLTVVMFLVGFILVLPGLCSLAFALQFGASDLIRLPTRDPYFELVLILWGISLVPTIGGIFLIRHAMRRTRGEP